MLALPTNRDENWRYANLRPFAKAPAEAVTPVDELELELPPPLAGFTRWVYVDGHHAPWLSDTPGDTTRILDAREAGAEFASLLDDEFAAAGVDFALSRLNAARGAGVMHVAPSAAAVANVEVLLVANATGARGISYPRVQVHAPRHARLNLVERHLSAGAADSVVNSAVDVAVAAGAEVNHTRLQTCADAATCFDTLTVHVAEQGRYALRTVTVGALAARTTAFIKLAGQDARCELVAASIANGVQNHDFFVEIDHAAPRTATRELFRGIANDRGKLAFNGKMIVRAEAIDADSDQSLKTLLSGGGAEAAARPQLEIHTDRVRARHGATSGKLDEQMLFYLLSRGLDRPTAQALLQWAFIEDAISKIEPAALRLAIEAIVSTRLHAVASLPGLLGDRP